MLDSLFQRPHHVRRLRANPLGTILDQFADYLTRRGHTACVVHQLLRAAEHYGSWLGTRNATVSPDQVTRGLGPTVPARAPRRPARARLGSHAASSRAGRRSTTCCGCSTSRTRPDWCRRRGGMTPSWPSTTVPPAGLRALRAHAPLPAAVRPRVPGPALRRRPSGPRSPEAGRHPGLLPAPCRIVEARIGRRPGVLAA